MESGTGVRASLVSRYSQEDALSVASDHEPDDSIYTASFVGPVDPLDQTHSSFAFDDAASFSTHQSQQDDGFSELSQSLDLTAMPTGNHQHQQQHDTTSSSAAVRLVQARKELEEENEDDQDLLVPNNNSSQQQHQQQQQQHPGASTAVQHASVSGLQHELPSGRQSTSSQSRSTSRAASLRARASADSLQLLQASHKKLPAPQHQEHQQPPHNSSHQVAPTADVAAPRPSSSSPLKRPSSSHRRSSGSRQPGVTQSAKGLLGQQQQQQQQKGKELLLHEWQQRHEQQQQQQLGHRTKPVQEQQKQMRRSSSVQRHQATVSAAAKHVKHSRHNKGSQAGPSAPPFHGDLSEWGRTALEDFYDEDVDEDGQSTASSQPTMSSGISPRETKLRLKAFDLEAARETLAYNAGMYSRAQVMRRDGTAPAAMGVADDLPTRMAYQQLNVLAGMAGKVQDAILHNKRIFEQRLLLEDRAVTKRAFGAWRAVRYGSVAKQDKLRRAAGRIMRGALSRAFFAWKDELHLVDRNLAMRRKVAATISRGLLKRCFQCWVRLAEERWWKNQVVMREREVALLESKIRGYEKRPIQVLRKRRLSRLLQAWFCLAEAGRSKQHAVARAGRFWVNQQLSKAWNAWVEHTEAAVRRRVLTQKVVARVHNLQLAAAWSAWLDVVDSKREKQDKVSRAAQHWHNACSARAWRAWCDYLAQAKAHKQIAQRWMQPTKAAAFSGWVDRVAWQKHSRLVVARALGKLQLRTVAAAFSSWLEAVRDSKVEAKLSTKEGMQDMLAKLQAENERLRRDNERFVRLIDSGEWGRGRVAELVSAGEVMQAERDALLKLIGGLRREYEAVQMAKGAQEEELKLLKEKMTVGGPARNRLLVKGGSSFNALVRAMKQDLVDSGTAAKDPSLLYEIDKLSMDRVQVYPDGELNVQAVASAGTSTAFARPLIKGGSPCTRGTSAGAGHCLPGSPVRSPSAARAASAASPGSGSSSLAYRAGSAYQQHQQQQQGPAAANYCYADAARHTTTSVVAAQPAYESQGTDGGAGSASSTQHVLHALSSLTAAQVDQLEAALKGGNPALMQAMTPTSGSNVAVAPAAGMGAGGAVRRRV